MTLTIAAVWSLLQTARIALIATIVAGASLACSAECVQRPDGNFHTPPREPVTVPTKLLMAHAEKRITPVFPPEAIKARVDGSVIVALEVDHDGAVTRTYPLSGPAMLLPAAKAALEQWHFEPFCMRGVAYTVRSAVEFQFRWHGGGSRQLPQ